MTESNSQAAAAPGELPVGELAAGQDAGAGQAASASREKTLTGRVVSAKMQKTIAVEIERLVKHPTYGKYVRRTTKVLAHDERNESREGDTVTIAPSRPLSRRKSWRLVAVVQRS